MARARTAADEKSGEISEGEVTGPPVVQSTTEATPTEASQTSTPNVVETDPEAPPLHTAKPDVAIAQSLAAGAGQHTPPNPDEFDQAGRPKSVSGTSVSEQQAQQGETLQQEE
jgi:hypothetical protein